MSEHGNAHLNQTTGAERHEGITQQHAAQGICFAHAMKPGQTDAARLHSSNNAHIPLEKWTLAGSSA
jgi:hypothetical protein